MLIGLIGAVAHGKTPDPGPKGVQVYDAREAREVEHEAHLPLEPIEPAPVIKVKEPKAPTINGLPAQRVKRVSVDYYPEAGLAPAQPEAEGEEKDR